jgi:hypothetical protein
MEKGIEESNQEQNRSGRSQYYGGPSIDASNGLTAYQRASSAYQRASLIQRAEAEKQRAITTGIAKDAEKRAISRDALNEKEQKIRIDIEEGKLRAANLEADRTLKVIEQGNGFLKDAYGMNPEDPKFDEQMQRMQVGYPLAFGTPGVSKGYPPVEQWMKDNMPIASLRRQNTLNENVKIEAEKRAEQAKIDAEKRAKTTATSERLRIEKAAAEAGAVATKFTTDGTTMETPAKADAAEAKAEMASLEKERKLSVDQFTKARNARTRAGAMLESAQKAKNQGLINSANDLIKAADDDINEWKAKRDEAESALKSRATNKSAAPAAGAKTIEITPEEAAGGVAPAATDRKARAQQALDDPEATDAERAAARRILGQ